MVHHENHVACRTKKLTSRKESLHSLTIVAYRRYYGISCWILFGAFELLNLTRNTPVSVVWKVLLSDQPDHL
jgi:hypothetical protein